MLQLLILPFVISALFGSTDKPLAQTQSSVSCQDQYPAGIPSVKATFTLLCRRAYLSAHDDAAKIPGWVVYRLTPDRAVGCEPRNNRFAPDPDLSPAARSTPRDYAGSGYDMGHMANAADMAWDRRVQIQSFLLSNISPQTPNLNRGVWKLLETYVRAWAHEGRSLTIYIGGVYDDRSPRIGSGVVVPSKFYKIIVNDASRETVAFMFPNEDKVPTKIDQFATSVADIEAASGIKFPTPGDKTAINLAWPADIKSLAQDKRSECRL